MIPFSTVDACTPAHVAPQTVAAIIRVESGEDPLAVHVNGGPADGTYHPGSVAEALAIVKRALADGVTADIGLMQVNTGNLPRLGYTAQAMLDPCQNIKAGAAILVADYSGALNIAAPGQRALLAALSAYNTGNYTQGFTNGYVAHYVRGIPAPPVSVTLADNPLTAPTSVFHRTPAKPAGAPVSRAAPAAATQPVSDPLTASTQIFSRTPGHISS